FNFIKVITLIKEPRFGLGDIEVEVFSSNIETLTIPANETESNPIDLSAQPLSLPGFGSIAVVDLLPVDIEPDANMAGAIGDVVKSAKAGSTIKHFVTPKKSTDLNQDYVILKATGGITAEQITPGHANQIVEWDGGEAVPNA